VNQALVGLENDHKGLARMGCEILCIMRDRQGGVPAQLEALAAALNEAKSKL